MAVRAMGGMKVAMVAVAMVVVAMVAVMGWVETAAVAAALPRTTCASSR